MDALMDSSLRVCLAQRGSDAEMGAAAACKSCTNISLGKWDALRTLGSCVNCALLDTSISLSGQM